MIKKICNLLKKPFSMFKKQNFWIQLIIVFIIFCVLQSLAHSAGFVEGLTNRDKKVLTYFHMSTCPHCVKFNPEWDKFVSSNKTGLATAKVESGEMTEKHKALGVNGFPTIMLLNGNGTKAVDYNGPRDAASLKKFAAENK